MSDRDAMLAAVTADPGDDTPRLVYADWLDEHGESDRAEFIRAQCRLEHVSRRTAEGKKLAARAKDLQARLFGHLSELGFTEVLFRRGFVDRVTAGLLVLRDNLRRLEPADAPAYELVVRWDEAEAVMYDDYDLKINTTAEVFEQPALRRCVSLDLPCMGMSPSEHVFGSEHLVNLRRLNFPDNEAGPNVESLASVTFANLRWANLNNSNSANGRPSIVPLAESPHLARLGYLDFGSNANSETDAEAVAAAKQWTRLHHLNLSGGWFSVGAVAALFETPHLPVLVKLDLSHSFASLEGDGYTTAIAASPLFGRLSKLALRGNGITDAGARALAAAPAGVQLEVLDLADNPIGPAGRRALVRRFGKGVCVFEGGDR